MAYAVGLTCGWLLGSRARAADRVPSGHAGHPVTPSAPAVIRAPAVLPTQPRVEAAIAAAQGRGDLAEASVRVKDLDSGVGYTIGAAVAHNPASILKLLVLTAALERDAREPGFLASAARWTVVDANTRESATDSVALRWGGSYRLDDLCRRMIVQSRNDAKALLSQAVGAAALEAAYAQVGMADARHAPGDTLARVDEVAAIVRRLAKPGALPAPQRELALGWLHASEFRLGLAAGAPRGASVASKFGRRLPAGPHGLLQLHDCGVIQWADATRLVCVMTRGATDAGLQRSIAAVARAVFVAESSAP